MEAVLTRRTRLTVFTSVLVILSFTDLAFGKQFCRSFLDKQGKEVRSQICYNGFDEAEHRFVVEGCCGDCFNRYCCEDPSKMFDEDSCDNYGNEGEASGPLPIGAYFAIIIALAVIVLGLFLVATFYQGCLCFKDKGYKDRRRQRTPKHIPKRLRPDAHMVQNNKNYQKVSTKHSNEMPRFALPAYNPTVKLPPTEEHVPLCEIINTETKVNLSENENEMQKRKRRKEAEVLKLKVEPDIHLENDSESISQSWLPAEEVNSESVNHHDTSDRNPEEHVVEINENTNRTIQSRPLPRNQGVQRESDVRTPTVQEPIERTQRNQQPIERLQINQQPIERVHRNEQLIERTQQIEQPAARAERIQPSFERDLRTQQPTETATRQPRLSQTLVRQSSSPPHIMPVDDEAPPPYEGVVGRPRRGHRRTNSGLNVL